MPSSTLLPGAVKQLGAKASGVVLGSHITYGKQSGLKRQKES